MTSTQKQSPAVELQIINYELIHAKDPVEIQKLVEACRPPPHGLGFFFLDLSGPSTNQAMLDVAEVNTSTRDYFGELPDVKMQDFLPGIDRGYKPSHLIESFEISTDEAAKGSLILPRALQSSSNRISHVLSSWDAVMKDIFSVLCSSIDPTGTLHDANAVRGPSDSGVKLCLVNDSIPAGQQTSGPHTDSGLLTIMHYDAASLELAVTDATGETTWSQPLQPVNGCAIVNLGDSFQALTEGRLHSQEHKPIKADEDGRGIVYPLYYLRPQHKQ